VFTVSSRKSETLSPSPIATNGERCDVSHDTGTIECRRISGRIIIMQFRDYDRAEGRLSVRWTGIYHERGCQRARARESQRGL